MKTKNTVLIAILVLLVAFGKVVAQPYSLDKKIKPKELIMKDYKKVNPTMSGKISVCSIVQDKDTAYYFVKGAGIYQTVVVSVGGSKPNQLLEVAFCKESWNKPNRSGKVEGKNIYTEKFKTEGSFGIRVISKQANSNYNIVAWISEERKKIQMQNAIVVNNSNPKK